MTAPYEYLLSSLPQLTFEGVCPMGLEDLLSACAPLMAPKAARQLRSARLDIEKTPSERASNAFLTCWFAFENTLRNALCRIRAKNLGVPEETPAEGYPADDFAALGLAGAWSGEQDPYRAETALLEGRWRFLEAHEFGHWFDLTALLIYALKVQILERKGQFDPDRGRRVLEAVLSHDHTE